ncbi:unnamed protein product [Camellia sinensis]
MSIMAYNHRKLSLDSPPSTGIPPICSQFYCDPLQNKNGTCPDKCIPMCRSICRHSLSPPPPPADPPCPTLSCPPNTPKKFPLKSIIPLSILAAIFLLLCFHIIYKHYKNRQRNRTISSPPPPPQQQRLETHYDFLDHGPVLDHPIWYIRTIGLNPAIIHSIPVCKYNRVNGIVEGTECSVCLNEFQEDETLRLLPKCNHAFHIHCIDIWLRSHTNCPLCRASIVTNPARLPTQLPEQSVQNSIVWEETQVVIPEGSGELRRETEEGGELGVESGEKRHEIVKQEVGDEIRPTRRSVSVDFSSASVFSAAMGNAQSGEYDGNANSQVVKVKEFDMGNVAKNVEVNQRLMRSMGDNSIGRSLQKGPALMKRSVSCCEKASLNPHG